MPYTLNVYNIKLIIQRMQGDDNHNQSEYINNNLFC